MRHDKKSFKVENKSKLAFGSSSFYVDVDGMAKKYVTNFVQFLQSITSNEFNFLPTEDQKGGQLLLEHFWPLLERVIF